MVTDRNERKLARKITYVVFTPITNNTKSNGGEIGIFVFAVLATFWVGFSVFVPKDLGFSVFVFVAVCRFFGF